MAGRREGFAAQHQEAGGVVAAVLDRPGDLLQAVHMARGFSGDRRGIVRVACAARGLGVAGDRDALDLRHLFLPLEQVLAHDLLQRALEADDPDAADTLYRDPQQPATGQPGFIPPALRAFGLDALRLWLQRQGGFDLAVGEVLSEPKPGVWFDAAAPLPAGRALRLHRRTRMLYDERHVFINGEGYRAAGRDARLMRRLADTRRLDASAVQQLGADAQALIAQWAQAGWLLADNDDGGTL